jgi:hypothetical protein
MGRYFVRFQTHGRSVLALLFVHLQERAGGPTERRLSSRNPTYEIRHARISAYLDGVLVPERAADEIEEGAENHRHLTVEGPPKFLLRPAPLIRYTL